jgi:hypothetical protein
VQIVKAFLILLAAACIALPALGDTHRIWVLGTEPLFARTSSKAQFFAQMRRHPDREAQALKKLGIDRSSFERMLRTAPTIVTGGWFHLDAMAYYSNGVKVTYDVAVPPDTWMWVVHMRRETIYVPQACGNISTVAVAAVESYATSFPVTSRQRALVASHARTANLPLPQVTQVASVPFPTPPASIAHHGKFPWWIFLVPGAFIHGHSSSGAALLPIVTPSSSPSPSPSPSATATPCPTPKPTPTPCPTPKPTPTPCPSGTKSR